jgi:hypothetical protein
MRKQNQKAKAAALGASKPELVARVGAGSSTAQPMQDFVC